MWCENVALKPARPCCFPAAEVAFLGGFLVRKGQISLSTSGYQNRAQTDVFMDVREPKRDQNLL